MIDDPAVGEPAGSNRALNTMVGLVFGAGLGLALGLVVAEPVVVHVLINGALGALVGALWHGPGLPAPVATGRERRTRSADRVGGCLRAGAPRPDANGVFAARTAIPETDTVIVRDHSWPAFSMAFVKLLPVALVFILGFLLLDRLG